jgi:hypothetical protein
MGAAKWRLITITIGVSVSAEGRPVVNSKRIILSAEA